MAAIQPFVAEWDGVIVGYADLQPDGLIDHFFCHHGYQGIGVGRTLMSHLLDVGSERDVARYYAHVSTTARPFFEHFGFQVTATKEVAVRGVKLRNHTMQRSGVAA